MLVEDAIVIEVALGSQGMRDSMPAGAIHLAMGDLRCRRRVPQAEFLEVLPFDTILKMRDIFTGPKGPTKDLSMRLLDETAQSRTWGCKRIAQQIALAPGVDIDKDMVRRILVMHFQPEAGSGGPSWLSFIGHTKDSLCFDDPSEAEPHKPSTHVPTCPRGDRSAD
jgi:hypothetical protein